MDMNIAQYMEEFLANFFTSGQTNLTAVQIQGAATDAGYSADELNNLDWGQVYENACNHPGVPSEYQGALQNHPAATVHTVVREVQTITQVQNTNIFDNSTTIDQSVDFDVEGDFSVDGDFDFHNNPVAADDGSAAAGNDQTGVAVGENATASGSGDANNASGGGGLINTGTNLGNQNTGDGAVQLGGTSLDLGFGGGMRDPLLTRELSEGGGASDGGFPFGTGQDININTGAGNQANVDGQGNQVNFGDGDNSNQNVANNDLDHSAISGGDAVAGNTSGDNSPLGIAGDDLGNDAELNLDFQQVQVDNSPGAQTFAEEGDGDQHIDQDQADDLQDVLPA